MKVIDKDKLAVLQQKVQGGAIKGADKIFEDLKGILPIDLEKRKLEVESIREALEINAKLLPDFCICMNIRGILHRYSLTLKTQPKIREMVELIVNYSNSSTDLYSGLRKIFDSDEKIFGECSLCDESGQTLKEVISLIEKIRGIRLQKKEAGALNKLTNSLGIRDKVSELAEVQREIQRIKEKIATTEKLLHSFEGRIKQQEDSLGINKIEGEKPEEKQEKVNSLKL